MAKHCRFSCRSHRRDILFSAVRGVERSLARQFAALSRARLLAYAERLAVSTSGPVAQPCSTQPAEQDPPEQLCAAAPPAQPTPAAAAWTGVCVARGVMPPTVTSGSPKQLPQIQLHERQPPPRTLQPQPPATPGRLLSSMATSPQAAEAQPEMGEAAEDAGVASREGLAVSCRPSAAAGTACQRTRPTALLTGGRPAASLPTPETDAAPQTPRKAASNCPDAGAALGPQTPQKAPQVRPALALSPSAAASQASGPKQQAASATNKDGAAVGPSSETETAAPDLDSLAAAAAAATATAAAAAAAAEVPVPPIGEAEAVALAAACAGAAAPHERAAAGAIPWPLYLIGTRESFSRDLVQVIEQVRLHLHLHLCLHLCLQHTFTDVTACCRLKARVCDQTLESLLKASH